MRPLIWASLLPLALADGVGLLGAGKWLYKPLCAHTCRYLLADSPILCEAGTDGHDEHSKRHAHPVSDDDPVCWLLDAAFLRTTALCIEDMCAGRDADIWTIERWWAGHLATGSIGDWSEEMKPAMTYQEALMLAHEDVADVGEENVPILTLADPLNVTSRVAVEDYLPTYNYQLSFQWGEFDHGSTSLAISITLVTIPILLSLTRFLPGHSRWSSRLRAILDQPLIGHKHRVPVFGNLGLMPTRGQSLFIAYIVIINIVLMCLPVRTLQPNSRFDSHHLQRVQIIGDRAGVLAFCLYVSLFLFSSRNNILLWITDWSHGTYLLLHRWVAYMCIFQTVMHSILLLHYYIVEYDHAAESQLPYWYWGIIATLATVLMYPLSILPVRQKMYEVFLAVHQLLAALVLIASFLHIWYLFAWDWGYEIWIYIAGGIWFLDRSLRIARIASNGVQTTTITVANEGSDLMRLEIDGAVAEGHVYLYFPTLSWRFWECHPFSVLSSFSGANIEAANPLLQQEKGEKSSDDEAALKTAGTSTAVVAESSPTRASTRPRVIILARPQTGTTKALLDRVRTAGGKLTLPVLIESSYHANPSIRQLSRCSTLVGIAGGVGITAVLPIAREFGGVQSQIFWSAKHDDITRAIQPELAQAASTGVEMHTTIGSRLDVAEILRDEMLGSEDRGDLGVVVCGPAAMADDVRRVVGELAGSRGAKRGVVFVDEAFSW